MNNLNKQQTDLIGESYGNYCKHFVGYDDTPKIDWFIQEIKNNTEFSKRWRLKIEERDLSLEERMELWDDKVKGLHIILMWDYGKTQEDALNEQNIPTKLITIIYKNETIESYE